MPRLKAFLQAIGLSAGLLAGHAGAQQATGAPDPAVVRTASGPVRGVVRNGVLEFRGIPYAAPPVGALRWASPQPAAAWDGMLEAAKFRSACPQTARYGLTEASEAEDCLHLSVSAPLPGAGTGVAKRPVIVWIHGGALVGGSASLYRLDEIVRSGDVVVVSMNYRLGVFGFMPHPAFAAEHNGGYALEDQRLALRWGQRNIAAFGGDPDNIALAGESAGGASVCMHLITPEQTTGLFHKAIITSAGCVFAAERGGERQARPEGGGAGRLRRYRHGAGLPAWQAGGGAAASGGGGGRRRPPGLCPERRQPDPAPPWASPCRRRPIPASSWVRCIPRS